ncbi:MAG TPA: HD-GYP domain-containing protein [Gemmatimonas sp.]|nr:HD-GYP domain-containing protein [Gemmatimonas sp.]
MQTSVRIYVGSVVFAAIAVTAALLFALPSLNWEYAAAPLAFAIMGLIAQSIGHDTGKTISGSIAFLPFLTSLILYPSWICVVFVGLAMLVGEFREKKAGIKRAFNVAQYMVAVGVATGAYVALGGKAIQVDDSFRFVPHTAAVLIFLMLNTLQVAIAVALSSSRSVFEVWMQNNRSTVLYDIVAVPLVFCFALFFQKMSWMGVGVGFIGLAGARRFYMSSRLLEIAYEETLEILVGAVELRDPYTSGHSQRVRKYSQIIASALQLPAKRIERIGIAALLHDVGKIDGIFVPILQKPGKLTPEERAIMELHPIKSAELVSRASQLADIVETVRHHHENWDGTGYPNRLSGTDIPLGSRIIMFADTIDAMTTDRPYRKALGPADVRSELIKHRGTQFDPTICDRLIDSPEFLRIFDTQDSGGVQTLTQMFDRVRRRNRTPQVA